MERVRERESEEKDVGVFPFDYFLSCFTSNAKIIIDPFVVKLKFHFIAYNLKEKKITQIRKYCSASEFHKA